MTTTEPEPRKQSSKSASTDRETADARQRHLAEHEVWITRFASVRQPVPTAAGFVSLAELFVELAEATREPFKGERHHPGFSCTRFIGKRSKGSALDAHAMLLDYDSGTTSIDEAVEFWGKWGGCVFTTKSHTSHAPRFRVMLPFSTPVPADRFPEAYAWVIARARAAGHVIDEKCRDVSRFWFWPGGAEAPMFSLLPGTRLLDFERDIHANGAAHDDRAHAREPDSRQGENGEGETSDEPSALLGHWVERVRNAVPDVDRNDTLNRAAFALGHEVAAGRLARDAVVDALTEAALGAGLDEGETARTIASGLDGAAREASRPTIRVGPDLHRVVSDCVKVIARDTGIFQRDGRLVRVVRVVEAEAEKERAVVGTPQIRDVPPATLLERLTLAARFERHDARAQKWVQTVPNKDVIQALAERIEFSGVAPIVGITETPLFRVDGTIIEKPGFDRKTGFLYEPGMSFPPVPQRPTQTDARAAFAQLVEVFADFPHRSFADRAVPIAALLTLLLRTAIRGATPAILFDGNVAGAGKGLQADAVSTIVYGRPAPKMSWSEDEVEIEKILGGYALRAANLICFDNIAVPFTGAPLDKVLTAADTVDLRVLGGNKIATLKWRPLIVGTGNNIVVQGDTTRRVLVSRLESSEERPEERDPREFKHHPLLPWLERDRARLVIAALSLARAWFVAGRPSCGCKTWGSFEPWSGIVPPMIVFAGGPDVMGCRIDAANDPTRRGLGALLQYWEAVFPEGATSREAIAHLWPEGANSAAGRDRTFDMTDEADRLKNTIDDLVRRRPGFPPTSQQLGNALRGLKGRVVGGRRLVTRSAHADAQRWHVEHVEHEPAGGDGGDGGGVSNPSPGNCQNESEQTKAGNDKSQGWAAE